MHQHTTGQRGTIIHPQPDSIVLQAVRSPVHLKKTMVKVGSQSQRSAGVVSVRVITVEDMEAAQGRRVVVGMGRAPRTAATTSRNSKAQYQDQAKRNLLHNLHLLLDLTSE